MTTTKSSRLEKLYDLARQIDLEIVAERRRIALDGGRLETPVRVARPQHSVARRLAMHNVTARQVRVWAKAHGLVDKINRGPLPEALLDTYLLHLREQDRLKETGS